MTRKKKRWLMAAAITTALALSGFVAAGFWVAGRFEPYIREKTVAYLNQRFDADVRLDSFKVRLNWRSTWDVLLRKGKGAEARVEAGPLVLRLNRYPSFPPILTLRKLRFAVDLATLAEPTAVVRRIQLEGLEVHVPPRDQRPALSRPPEAKSTILIDVIEAPDSRLVIHPKDPGRAPLAFELHELALRGAGPGRALNYEAKLTNAKPPGVIHCQGQFGPWVSDSPSDSPVSGTYTFQDADLSVFKGIAGKLASQGSFAGVLNEIVVDGTTATPDFRLTSSGNRVPLDTEFHAIVDGTNGNTLLRPVRARLGRTRFTVTGSVARNTDEKGKTVDLQADVPAGRLDDFLLLAMKGAKPFMSGGIGLKTRVIVPPGKGQIEDRLQLHGSFRLADARFTSRAVQDKLDELSRRAQGAPANEEVDEVPCVMNGDFRMAGGQIEFPMLAFSIPGADMDMKGRYTFGEETLDFAGEARIRARVSQMMVTRWKRWALKAADPFFAKDGHGMVANFKVRGTREHPQFSLK